MPVLLSTHIRIAPHSTARLPEHKTPVPACAAQVAEAYLQNRPLPGRPAALFGTSAVTPSRGCVPCCLSDDNPVMDSAGKGLSASALIRLQDVMNRPSPSAVPLPICRPLSCVPLA